MQLSYSGRFVCCSRPFSEWGPETSAARIPAGAARPLARSGHACAADESNLYLYGGFNNKLGPSQNVSAVLPELWIYNFSTFTWRQINSPGIPGTAASASLRLWNKKLFLYGGTGFPFGNEMCNTLYICHIDSDFRWDTVSVKHTHPNNLPWKAYGQGVACNQGDIYVFGGAIGLYLDPINHLHRLNFSGKRAFWQRLDTKGDEPLGRYKTEIVVHPSKERFYVIGGGNLWGSQTLEKLDTFEFSTSTWSISETQPDRQTCLFPKGRAAFGCVHRDNLVIISGGRHYDIDNSEALDDVWVLDLIDLQWKCLSLKLPLPLFFHSMALSSSGTLYVFGGVHNDIRQGTLYEAQVFMPKLSELCWAVFTKSVNDISYLKAEKLLERGVPREFIKRLLAKDLKRVSISCDPS